MLDWFQNFIWDDAYKQIDIRVSKVPFNLVRGKKSSIQFLEKVIDFAPTTFETDVKFIVEYKWRRNWGIFLPMLIQMVFAFPLMCNAARW